MVTQAFATKTMFLSRKNTAVNGYWGVALDIGYSSVKGFSQNAVFSFPSFARKSTGRFVAIGDPAPQDILYRDEQGVWNVGASALAALSSDDRNDSLDTLFGRNRYFSPMFLVLCRTGFGLGMMTNKLGSPEGKKLTLQTGLPPAYLDRDAQYIKEALTGRHRFELRVGRDPWTAFDFELDSSSIRVMPQPMGSLLGVALDNECRQTPEGTSCLAANLLVLDAGFGTVDVVNIRRREIVSSESFDDVGMKAVFAEAAREINRTYNAEVQVHTIQKCLQTGYVQSFDRRTMSSRQEPIAQMIVAANQKVCNAVLERIKTMYNNLIDYDYLIVTGGTGAAWFDIIRDHFKGMETLKVIAANQNDMLPYIYSNVRGYYLFLVGALRKAAKTNAN